MSPTVDVLQLVNLLLVPMVGLLWRISNQLASMNATQAAHHDRISNLERKTAP